MAASVETAHQQHVQKLKSLSSMMHLLSPKPFMVGKDEEEEEDPEEVAYRKRLSDMTGEADTLTDLQDSKDKKVLSAQRAAEAMKRASAGASDITWVAG